MKFDFHVWMLRVLGHVVALQLDWSDQVGPTNSNLFGLGLG
jgi:hypothetical protein